MRSPAPVPSACHDAVHVMRSRPRTGPALGRSPRGLRHPGLRLHQPDHPAARFPGQVGPLRARAVGPAADDGAARRRRLGARRAAGQAQRQRRGAPAHRSGADRGRRARCWRPRRRSGSFVAGMAVYGVGLGVVDASTNMQAVALEHRYDRPILPVVPRRLDARRHRRRRPSRWPPPTLPLAAPRLAGRAAAGRAVRARSSAATTASRRGQRRRRGALAPDPAGRAWRWCSSTWSTPPRRPGDRRTSTTRSRRPRDLVALATFPYLVASLAVPAGRRPPGRPARRGPGARGSAPSSPPIALAVVVFAPDLAGRGRSASPCSARAPP